jgi:hypothetical protein
MVLPHRNNGYRLEHFLKHGDSSAFSMSLFSSCIGRGPEMSRSVYAFVLLCVELSAGHCEVPTLKMKINTDRRIMKERKERRRRNKYYSVYWVEGTFQLFAVAMLFLKTFSNLNSRNCNRINMQKASRPSDISRLINLCFKNNHRIMNGRWKPAYLLRRLHTLTLLRMWCFVSD